MPSLRIYMHMVVVSVARYSDDAGFIAKVLEHCCASAATDLHFIKIEKVLPLFSQVITSRESIDGQRRSTRASLLLTCKLHSDVG